MRKQTTETASESRPEWETLEHWLRARMQNLVQHVQEVSSGESEVRPF